MLRLKRRECNPIWRNCRRYRLALLLFVMALLFVVGFSVVVVVAAVVGVVVVVIAAVVVGVAVCFWC